MPLRCNGYNWRHGVMQNRHRVFLTTWLGETSTLVHMAEPPSKRRQVVCTDLWRVVRDAVPCLYADLWSIVWAYVEFSGVLVRDLRLLPDHLIPLSLAANATTLFVAAIPTWEGWMLRDGTLGSDDDLCTEGEGLWVNPSDDTVSALFCCDVVTGEFQRWFPLSEVPRQVLCVGSYVFVWTRAGRLLGIDPVIGTELYGLRAWDTGRHVACIGGSDHQLYYYATDGQGGTFFEFTPATQKLRELQMDPWIWESLTVCGSHAMLVHDDHVLVYQQFHLSDLDTYRPRCVTVHSSGLASSRRVFPSNVTGSTQSGTHLFVALHHRNQVHVWLQGTPVVHWTLEIPGVTSVVWIKDRLLVASGLKHVSVWQ